ncbi:MAG: hypothetical protein WCB77_05695, partial [Pseudolabrys sp.]
MPATYKILIMGASYGSLLASKILFGGHSVHLVCLPAEADLINAEGFRVRMPVKGRKDQIEIDSRKLPGKVSAGGAAGVNPKDYDLVGLAMQEPQYRSPGVRELLDAVAKSKVPCMSIMNMPPLPYVKRIPGLNYDALKPAYTDPTVWDNFEPGLLTLCSPDPQAIRPPDEKVNVLQVTLPTNFKVAKFDNDMYTGILRQLEKDIDAVRFDTPEGKIELPVKGRKDAIEIDSRKLPGNVSAAGPGDVTPKDFDLVGLAMQEPQYRSPGVRELLDAVAKSKVPCMSIMNMPPLPYLARIPGLDVTKCRAAFTDAAVWDSFDPGLLTLCSPDPQAIRPPEEKVNVLQVTLPTNFKV